MARVIDKLAEGFVASSCAGGQDQLGWSSEVTESCDASGLSVDFWGLAKLKN